MNKKNTKRAFTLIEILVASSIFAVVLILVTATVAETSTYRKKLTEMRTTLQASRTLADQITTDVRSANGAIKITDEDNVSRDYKNGLALLKYDSGALSFIDDYSTRIVDDGKALSDPVNKNIVANVLVLSSSESVKVYLAASDTYKIYYKSFPASAALTAVDITGIVEEANVISPSSTETFVHFGGYSGDDTDIKMQSYVSFFIYSRTKNYTTVDPRRRAEARIRSSITSRSYNY